MTSKFETSGGTRHLTRKSSTNKKFVAAAMLVLSSGGMLTSSAFAANGLWTDNATSGGLWGTTGNWLGGTVANGTDSIATFNTPSVVNTVNLDGSYTLGGLNFNTTSTTNTWNISNNGISTNILTLATSTASAPTIFVQTLNSIQTISATIAGTQGFTKSGQGALLLTGSNSYSGITTLNSTTSSTGADLYLGNNNALGTSSLYIDPGAAFNLRVLLNAGIVIPNNITINTSRAAAGANSSLMTNGNVAGAGVSGSITINSKAGSGGHISGPSDSTLANFLTLTGPIYLSAAYNAGSGNIANSGGDGLLIRSGNVIFAGGGSYYRAEVRSGELRDGANNGIATNAYLDLAGNANGNPLNFGILDLAGYNQTLVGVQNALNNGTTATITNSNASAPSVLTFAPVPASNTSSGNLIFTAGGGGTGTNATITDTNTSGAYLSLVINGDAAGVQTLNTPSSSYHGSTTLTSGTLAVNSLSNGGSNSAIGASSNAATNLVFNGGTLAYTGASTSTDRDWTTNTTANINVSNSATILSMTSGGGLGGTGTGGLTKLGAGTLLFSGVNSYTGPTLISGGKLLIDGSLAAGSAVSIGNGATLGGTGSVAGTVLPAAGGIIAPGDPATNNGVGTFAIGTLNLSTGSLLNFELTSGSGNDEINVANLNIITGANLDLYSPGTTTTFSTNGIYPLFNVSGSVTGSLNSLSVATPAAGKAYSLSNSGGIISLTIGTATTIEWNDNAGTNNWSTPGNWIGGVVPNGVGQTALFGSNLVGGNGTVTLTSPETVSGVVFNNSGVSYAIGGSSALTVNNGVAAASIDVLNGTHSINVPITLASATALNTTNSGDSLTISGNMTGANAVTVTGPGTVTLTGTNSFTTTSVTGSTLNVGTGTTGTLGSGSLTLSNAAVNFNSNVNYNFGQSITGSGSVTQSGSNILTVGAISGVTTVNVSNGSLVSTSIGQSGGVNVTGSGSLTVSGAVTGAGKLTVNTTGSVLLSGTDTYAGGTEVDAGSVTLNSTSALPTASALAVNGGTLDLHGNSISINNVLDQSGSTGKITNSVAATTSTINFSAGAGNYNIYASINDGPSGGKVALADFIDNTTSSGDGVGNQYALLLNATSNYSGGTTVTKQSIGALATNALGTGPVTLTLNDSSTNNTRLYVAGGVTLPNNITIAQPNPYAGYGAIQYYNGSTGSATLTGSVTQQADPFSGGTFVGPTAAGSFLNVNGPVYTTGTATTISARGGNIGFGGGGSYPNLAIYGNVVVNATNGIATNAAVNFPQGAPTLDLTGFNQTIAGLTVTTGTAVVTNSSATPSTLTVNNAVANNFSGGTLTGNLSLAKGAAGTLLITGTNTYTGNTTISAGRIQLGTLPQPSLVAAYTFDNTTATPVGTPTIVPNSGSGGTTLNGTVIQSSTSSNSVQITSGGPNINGNGGNGNALTFDGSGGKVDIASGITDLSAASNWTVSAWVQTSQSGSTILSKDTSGGWTTGNSIFFFGGGNGAGGGTLATAVRYAGGFVSGSTPVTDGNWHMVTYVDNGGTKTIYVDGVADSLTQTGFTTTDVGNQVELGFTPDTVVSDGTANIAGSLDDINIFSGALSAAQVGQLYSTNTTGAFTSSYVLPSSTALNLNGTGASLDLNGNLQAVASLSGVAGSQVILGGGTLVVGDSTPSTTFAGSITDAGGASNGTGGGLVKQGSGTLILSSTNTYSGGTTVNAGLIVAGSGTASLGSGVINVNSGGVIFKSTSAGTIFSLLQTGFNSGKWNGATGIISTSASQDSSHLHAIGMLQPSSTTTFEGQPLTPADIAIKYTYYGDANLDGKVDGTDYSRIDSGYLTHATGWYNGDFNYDGVVNGSDYTLIDNAFNRQGAQVTSELATLTAQVAGAPGGSAVPEPASLALGLGTLGVLARRRPRTKN